MNSKSTVRNVLITGVTRGLGRAMAEEFIKRGHVVAGCGRSGKHIAELGQVHVAPHSFAVVDVADDRQVGEWATYLTRSGFVPDLLLNNAAMINQPAPLWEVPYDEMAAILDVNIRGCYSVIRHVAPLMIARGQGVIVNFSSGWGRSTSPDVAPYCTTKYAIEGMTSALAQSLPKGLAAVAYSPGIIDTDMLRVCFGYEAGQHEPPDQWAPSQVDKLLALSAKDNGRSL